MTPPRRRLAALSLLAVAAVVAGGAALAWRHFDPPPDLTPDPAAVGWPADQAWAWTFRLPPGPGGVGLVFRRRSTPTTTNVAVDFFPSAMPAREADAEFGTGWALLPAGRVAGPGTGTAVVQLLDLADVGATSTRPGQTLRLLARMSVGGTVARLSGDQTILPPGRIAGFSQAAGDGRWAGDELYLMSFYVRPDAAVVRYDALLQRKANP